MARVHPNTPKSVNSSSGDFFLSPSQKNILMTTVSMIAWLSISLVSFYFSHTIAIGAIEFATSLHVWMALTAAFSVACVALFNALMVVSMHESLPKEYSPPPRLAGHNAHSKKVPNKTAQKSQRKDYYQQDTRVTFTTPPVATPSNSTTMLKPNGSGQVAATGAQQLFSGINPSNCGVVTRTWKYTEDGKTLSGDITEEYMNTILRAKKRSPSDPKLSELTSQICDVVANGSCGYYCLAVLILHNAKDPAFREKMIQKVEKAFSDETHIDLFGASRNPKALGSLKSKIIEMLKLTATTNVENILAMNNASEFDAFLRALILANLGSLPKNMREAITPNSDAEKGLPNLKTEIASKTGWIQEPMIAAIAYLLDIQVGMIQYMDGMVVVPKKPITPPHGYLIFIEGKDLGNHYVYGIPRK